MRKKLFCFLFIAYFFIVLPTGSSDKDYYPLSEDQLWEYEITGEKPEQSVNLRFETGKPRNLHGYEAMPLLVSGPTGRPNVVFMSKNHIGIFQIGGPQELHSALPSEDIPSELTYILKFPLDIETSWHNKHPNGMELSQIESISDTVTVPAGTFIQCILVRTVVKTSSGAQQSEKATWFAPGVGPIKEVSQGQVNYVMQLKSFRH